MHCHSIQPATASPSAQLGSYTPDSFTLGDAGSLAVNMAEFSSCKVSSLKVGTGAVTLNNNKVRWSEGAVTASTLRSNCFQSGGGPTSFLFSNWDVTTGNLCAIAAVFESSVSLTSKYALSNMLATVAASLSNTSNVTGMGSNIAARASNQALISILASNTAPWTSNQLPSYALGTTVANISSVSVFGSNTASWTSNQLPSYALGATVANVSNNSVFGSNTASWTSNQVAELVSPDTQATFSNFITPIAVTGCNLVQLECLLQSGFLQHPTSARVNKFSNSLMPLLTRSNVACSNLTIGMSTAVGALSIKGSDLGGATSPSVNPYTTANNLPILQILPYAHNFASIVFDAYWDGSAWRSSTSKGKFLPTKTNIVSVLTQP
jgi:hypothetical protein